MKILLSLVLLLPLLSNCTMYEVTKVERTEAEFNNNETKIQDEIDQVQSDLDQLKTEVKTQKKESAK